MVSVPRLQAYLRHSAGERYETFRVPVFTRFLHPRAALPSLNYAVPDQSSADDLAHDLSALSQAPTTRSLHRRIASIDAFAPRLAGDEGQDERKG